MNTFRQHFNYQSQNVNVDQLFCHRWKLVQLGLDDQYKRLNEVRGKERVPNTQVFNADTPIIRVSILKNIYPTSPGFSECGRTPALGESDFPQRSALLHKVSFHSSNRNIKKLNVIFQPPKRDHPLGSPGDGQHI